MSSSSKPLRDIDISSVSQLERARLRCRLAKELEEAGDYEGARAALGELWQRIGDHPRVDDLDKHTAAEVLLRAGSLSGWIGSANQIDGAQEIAKDLISKSATIFETLQAPDKVAEAYVDLAICYWREGAFDEARVTLREALARLADKDGEQKGRALFNSGIVEMHSGRFNDALNLLTQAEPFVKESENHAAKGRFHNQLALVLRKLSSLEQREDYTDRALVEYAAASYHFEQAGQTRYRARVENNLGFLFFIRGDFKKAHEHLKNAHLLFTSLKDAGGAAQVDDTLARLLLAQKRNAEAEKLARDAVRTLEKGDEHSPLAEALTTHAVALARLGRYDESRLTLERAISIASQAGDKEGAGLASLTIVEELGDRLKVEEMANLYAQADELLADSQNPETLERLRSCARRALEAGRARTRESAPPNFIYADEQTVELLRTAHRISTANAPVLITGETGTGKELLARMIHEWSGRAGQFIAINCAALTESLLESILFGHRKGSFKDAVQDSIGMVHQAAGGTLFLDEIAELNLANQGKLLRLIENGEAQAIGSSGPEHVDVRIIASSNRNLKELVARREFRDDLLYRLNTFHLEIPPLRKRPEDISALAAHFAKELAEQHNRRVRFTPDAIEAMRRLPLHGNTRELRSLIERTILTATDGTQINREAVEVLAARQNSNAALDDAWAGCSFEEEVLRYEASLVKLALDNSKGSVTRAARLLGITHQRLCSMLQGRHKDLLPAKKPTQKRKRSIIRK